MGVFSVVSTHLHGQTIVFYTECLNDSADCGNIFPAKERN